MASTAISTTSFDEHQLRLKPLFIGFYANSIWGKHYHPAHHRSYSDRKRTEYGNLSALCQWRTRDRFVRGLQCLTSTNLCADSALSRIRSEIGKNPPLIESLALKIGAPWIYPKRNLATRRGVSSLRVSGKHRVFQGGCFNRPLQRKFHPLSQGYGHLSSELGIHASNRAMVAQLVIKFVLIVFDRFR